MSTSLLKIVIAQLNLLVGDIEGNCTKLLAAICQAKEKLQADCVVFSELAIIGYPPEDLLFRPKVLHRVEKAVQALVAEADGITVVVGSPCMQGDELYNAVLVLQEKSIIAKYYKQILPNYNVFDEERYFSIGTESTIIDIQGARVGITICEDIWQAEPARNAKQQGAELILNINASPYHVGKQQEREDEVGRRIAENDLPIIYVNQIGGQDELVFD